MNTWLLQVQNYSQGVATNVRISTSIVDFMRYKGFNLLWRKKTKLNADGPTELLPEKEAVYMIKGFEIFRSPVYIKWESISGKKYKKLWKVSGDKKDIIQKASFFFQANCFLQAIWTYMRLPYILIKDRMTNYSIYEEQVLRFLLSKGNQNYDSLLEEFGENEKLQDILWKMNRHGYIAFNGEDARITEKGKRLIEV